MASGNLIWVFIIGGIIVLATAAVVILRALRHDEDDAELPEAPPAPAPAPRPAAPGGAPRPVSSSVPKPEMHAETLRPAPVRLPRPEEKQLFRYSGKRADWWVCPNCACENDPGRTHCRVCLWDRSVEVK